MVIHPLPPRRRHHAEGNVVVVSFVSLVQMRALNVLLGLDLIATLILPLHRVVDVQHAAKVHFLLPLVKDHARLVQQDFFKTQPDVYRVTPVLLALLLAQEVHLLVQFAAHVVLENIWPVDKNLI